MFQFRGRKATPADAKLHTHPSTVEAQFGTNSMGQQNAWGTSYELPLEDTQSRSPSLIWLLLLSIAVENGYTYRCNNYGADS